MLQLSVDARVVAHDARGIGRYARAVLRRLLERSDVAITLLLPGALPQLARRGLQRALGSSRFRISARVPRNADVVWYPANGTFFASTVPSVATIHDAVPFRYPADDLHRRAREQQPFIRSVRNARRFIAVSEFGANELCEAFDIARDRIDVIYHGVDAAFSPGDASPLPDNLRAGTYVLFVGNPHAEPRKNFALLYEAHEQAWPDRNGPALVVAGGACALPGVVSIGEVGDDVRGGSARLRALYRGALALALPSYHETFGMPLIEAMACGTPAIAASASCLPEVGGDAALYAPPGDAGAWAHALSRVARDAALRADLSARGLERARRFDWSRCAQAHHDLFARVARGAR